MTLHCARFSALLLALILVPAAQAGVKTSPKRPPLPGKVLQINIGGAYSVATPDPNTPGIKAVSAVLTGLTPFGNATVTMSHTLDTAGTPNKISDGTFTVTAPNGDTLTGTYAGVASLLINPTLTFTSGLTGTTTTAVAAFGTNIATFGATPYNLTYLGGRLASGTTSTTLVSTTGATIVPTAGALLPSGPFSIVVVRYTVTGGTGQFSGASGTGFALGVMKPLTDTTGVLNFNFVGAFKLPAK